MASVKCIALVMVLSVLACTVAEAAVQCTTVRKNLLPCVQYLQGKPVSSQGGCCSGVRSLYQATARVRGDRVSACNCIKTLARQLGSTLVGARVSSLPGSCGVNLGYSISPTTNCNTIK